MAGQALAHGVVGNRRQLANLIAQLGDRQLHTRGARLAPALVGHRSELGRRGVDIGGVGGCAERSGDGGQVLTGDAVHHAGELIQTQN